MIANTLYPQITLKIEESIIKNSGFVSVKTDTGEIIKLRMLDKENEQLSSEDIAYFLKTKAENIISENKIRKKKEEIEKNESLIESLTEKVLEDYQKTNPNATQSQIIMEIQKKLPKLIKDEAERELKIDAYIKKDSIIRVAGISKIENGQMVLNSQCLLYDGMKPAQSGLYMYAVNKHIIPIQLEKRVAKNTKPYTIIKLARNISKAQLKTFFDLAINTIDAYKKGEILQQPIPRFFMVKKVDEGTFPKELIQNIKSLNKENDAIDNINILKFISDFLQNNFQLYDYLGIQIPISMPALDYDSYKNTLRKIMINTTLRGYLKNHKRGQIEEAFNRVFDRLNQVNQIKLMSVYNIPPTGYGFIANNVSQNFIVKSDTIEKIIKEMGKESIEKR